MKNLQERVWHVGWVVGILLCVFLGVISIKEIKSIAYVGKDTPVMNAITVNGKGESVSIPDIATFSFGVTETAKKTEDAQARATAKVDLAIGSLRENGVAETDIKTTSYNINPHYDYSNSACNGGGSCLKPVLTGYDVSQTIEVKIRDLKKAGSIFATMGSLDISNINGLAFSIDNIDTIKAKARDVAIDDAQAKAKVLAKQLGVHLVRITSFYDQSDEAPCCGVRYDAEYSTKSVMVPPPPSVPAGEQKVVSKVSITYEIR